jgi:DNA-binding protein YbaB
MTMPVPEQAMAELERAISDYPQHVADLSDRVTEAAGQTVTGEDPGGLVTVTATGSGQIRSVRLTLRALRDLDDRRLADCVVDAANEALARAEALLDEATGGQPGPDDIDARLAAFENRMDDTLYELDRIDRMLDRFDS